MWMSLGLTYTAVDLFGDGFPKMPVWEDKALIKERGENLVGHVTFPTLAESGWLDCYSKYYLMICLILKLPLPRDSEY